MIMPSNVCQNDPSTSRSVPSPSVTASNRPSIGTRILSQGTDASKHNPKNAQRGMNLGASKSSTSGTTKNKSQCAVHGLANHPMEKCKIYKYFLANHAQPSGTFTAPVAIPSGSGTVSSNICFRYTGNIPWSREHAAVCPRDKSNFRPARAIRSACLVSASSSVPAPTRVTTSTADVNQLPGSNSMMDIDDNGFPVDYNCKSHKTFVNKTQKDVLNNTNLSLIATITIEHINTMALVDSGSSFSAIGINFVNKYNIKITTNVSGSVILVTSDSTSKRFGTTNNPLDILYGDNNHNLIHTSPTFEALALSLENDVVIGLPILPDLSCALVPEYDFISFPKGYFILSYFLFKFYQ